MWAAAAVPGTSLNQPHRHTTRHAQHTLLNLAPVLQVPLIAAPMAGITAAPLRLMYTQVGIAAATVRSMRPDSLLANRSCNNAVYAP
jgi:hypothetical protein